MNQYTAFDFNNLFEQNFFSNLDYFFARSMGKAFNENDPIVLTSCALVSKSLSEGHICLDIRASSAMTRSVKLDTRETLVKFPDFKPWVAALQKSLMISDTIQTPLVLDNDYRLYFSKYYDFQNRLSKNIAGRVSIKPFNLSGPKIEGLKTDGVSIRNTMIGEAAIDQMLDIFFPCFTGEAQHINRQRNAVKNAVLNQFTIISGGPGTGKTYVTGVIKKIFLSYAQDHNLPEPVIVCVAPTGKAASKMEQGSTIHSILKPLKNTPGFYYNKNNPLQADVVIIDESSMIDILLLTRLLEAVPMSSKIIMLGDKYQLSSIQAGSVFSDICSVKGLSKNIFLLEYNFRSKGKNGIEAVSKAINGNDAQGLEDILTHGLYPDVLFESLDEDKNVSSAVHQHILNGYRPFLDAGTKEAALNELDAFKILCAHNSGEYGTLQINHICEKILRSENNFDIDGKVFNRIIMVKTNDYKKKLFNGDTGIVHEIVNEKDKGFYALFKSLDNTIKQYRYSDIPGHATAFAITIHKSQGSEFETVLIIVPDKLSPVVTRQLLYTGVTRAKAKVIIVGNITIIKKAISLSVERNSGLSTSLDKDIRVNL